ncbi:hypothetical protein FH972_021388 [Carpinus fangiana]|uniref:Uncharacterized protein n=1 Tax=Carpinus fangiana TaxID=176857 RepID=A0A5N6KPF4_9ROSI|nr:hypothetical protein FH972_021388 [Carpinus fangiana]
MMLTEWRCSGSEFSHYCSDEEKAINEIKRSSPFLQLPLEIRYLIYEILLKLPSPIELWPIRSVITKDYHPEDDHHQAVLRHAVREQMCLGLLRVNRQKASLHRLDFIIHAKLLQRYNGEPWQYTAGDMQARFASMPHLTIRLVVVASRDASFGNTKDELMRHFSRSKVTNVSRMEPEHEIVAQAKGVGWKVYFTGGDELDNYDIKEEENVSSRICGKLGIID